MSNSTSRTKLGASRGGVGAGGCRIITDLTELGELTTMRTLLLGSASVKLDLAGMPPQERRHWEALLNKYLSACGCAEGGLLALVSLGAYIVYIVMQPDSSESVWIRIGLGFGIACVGAVLGKSVGLIRARWRLQRAVRRLRIAIDNAGQVSSAHQ